MTLAFGTKLGPYEIVSPIGAGGMGEVYKAKDARLGRDVAIKVLPAHLTDDPDLKIRFEREARAISQLTHPHICTLYDVGNADGVEYLVMELLEGQTLADRLDKGALPTEQVIRFGVEIADALDRAHRAGIVHRDLKPGNVMLTKSGVKLLDFGLAKAAASERREPDLSSLPTEMSRPLTQKGTVMGTFQYMAPEQLEGKEADARTDIFALGCVLYEMATGKKAFSGSSQASLVSAILRDEPRPISEIAPMAPPALDRLVKTCLAKDPEERWQSAHDVMSELRWIGQAGSQAGAPAVVVSRRKNREKLAWGIAAAAIVGVAVLARMQLRRRTEPAPTIRFEVSPPPDVRFGYGLAISPDGSQLVFEGAVTGKPKLYLRRLWSTEVKELPGTEGATFPFWSPDGTRLAFFVGGSLKRYDLATGSVQTLAPAGNGRGGTWSRDGVILYAPDTGTGLSRVSADGGTPTVETTPDPRGEGSHRWPSFLPDGHHYLYLVRGAATGKPGIYVGELGSKKRRFITEAGSTVAYSPPGFLLYVRQKALVAQRFDAGSLEALDAPFPIVADMEALGDTQPTGYARFSVSGNGILAVRSGVSSVSQFAWLDREGKRISAVGSAGEQDELSLSLDEKYVVFERNDPAVGTNDLWRLELERGVESRLTYDPGSESSAIWLPDGRSVIYSGGGVVGLSTELAQINSAGTGGKRVLLKGSEGSLFADAVSPDGKLLLYEYQTQKGSLDLMLLPLEGGGKPAPYLATPFDEAHGQFSPDGRYVSYTSSESGREEIYVRPFPAGEEKWQVSTFGGDQATWKGDGTELYYLSPQQEIMAVPVERKASGLSFGTPVKLFAVRVPAWGVTLSRSGYQVSHDGKRFLVNQVTGGTDRSPITVALNWTGDIKK